MVPNCCRASRITSLVESELLTGSVLVCLRRLKKTKTKRSCRDRAGERYFTQTWRQTHKSKSVDPFPVNSQRDGFGLHLFFLLLYPTAEVKTSIRSMTYELRTSLPAAFYLLRTESHFSLSSAELRKKHKHQELSNQGAGRNTGTGHLSFFPGKSSQLSVSLRLKTIQPLRCVYAARTTQSGRFLTRAADWRINSL